MQFFLFGLIFTLFTVCTGTCTFDCVYECTRGYGCFSYEVNVGPPFSFNGNILMCNTTGCKAPPWGCKLRSFSNHNNTCKSFDPYCDSKYPVCCSPTISGMNRFCMFGPMENGRKKGWC